MQSGLGPFPGYQTSCGIVPNGSGRSLQYIPGFEVLACSLRTNLNNATLPILQLCPSSNHQVKLFQLLGGRCGNFLGVFSQIDM